MEESILDINREIVFNDYNSASKKNKELFITGDVKASSEYIFDNQKEDALVICNKFYETPIRVISIVKRTKVGMDGLMIEIAKNMSTHPNNDFVLHRNNIFFITAMSNRSWEDDMKDKIPSCFKDNVFHHGKLQRLKSKLKNIKNAIIINDEIDSGDKEDQKLHLILKESGILDIKYMEENNIYFVFVSATIINELRDLYKWGDKHYTHYMSIPESYISHKDFLELNIIKEYYSIHNDETAEKWVQEDILQNYGLDYRIHIIRTDEKNKDFIFNACIRNNIEFKNHTSDDRISYEELSNIFDNIKNHLVIAVKGFYRRANLIPNKWKKKIGATHERYLKKYDTNVQVQGLPGRMTGYWKNEILNGYKTGPHRTSIDAINEYEEFYKNPFGKIKYSTTGSKNLFVNPKNIKNLEITIQNELKINKDKYRVYDNEEVLQNVCKLLSYDYKITKNNSEGFKETSLNSKKEVVSITKAISKVPTAYGTNNGIKTWRTYYPCYVDITDNKTLRFVLIIRPDTDINKVKNEIDTLYPSIQM
uniref:Uncharacterized protein n=1 Tax=viral metagenome TaxID=1070528 RepID=A0A6C0HSP7_9ZZZZ